MTPLDRARALWREHFADYPTPRAKLREDGGATFSDGLRIVRVSPPPRHRHSRQLAEVVRVVDGREVVIMRADSWVGV